MIVLRSKVFDDSGNGGNQPGGGKKKRRNRKKRGNRPQQNQSPQQPGQQGNNYQQGGNNNGGNQQAPSQPQSQPQGQQTGGNRGAVRNQSTPPSYTKSMKKWARKNQGKLLLAGGLAGLGAIGYALGQEANDKEVAKQERKEMFRRLDLYTKANKRDQKSFSGYDDYPWEYEDTSDLIDNKDFLIKKLGRVGFLVLLAENMKK